MLKPKVKVLEQFLSWQGEGPSAGRVAWFYRFAGCNLRCSWCDTKYSWWGENKEDALEPPEDVGLIVVTGGEPLMDKNREQVSSLIQFLLYGKGVRRIEIETNGTCEPLVSAELDRVTYIVSPKVEGGLRSDWFARDDCVFKFVIGSKKDVEFFECMVQKIGDRDRVWVMPCGTNLKEIMHARKYIMDVAERWRVNISLRYQILYNFK